MNNESNKDNSYKNLLEKTQKKLSEIEHLAKIGTWEYLLDSQELIWSEQMYKIFKRPSELGNPKLSDVSEAIHFSDRFQWELLVNRVSLDGEPFDVCFRLMNDTNEISWIRKTAKGVFDQDKLVSIRGFCQDITEVKRLESHFELTKNLVEE